MRTDTGAYDHDVDTAEYGGSALEDGGDRSRIDDVAGDGQRLPAGGGDDPARLGELRLGTRCAAHRRAGTCIADRDRPTDASAGAGDHGDLALQWPHVGVDVTAP